jgi:toxin ParE1/3/4
VDYLLQRNPDEAAAVLDRIEGKAAALRTMPLRGRVVPELEHLQIRDYREIQIAPYRLIYRVAGDRVLVLAVFDGRRNLEDVLLDRILASP